MRRLLLGFIAGFISTLTFHQLTLWLLHAMAIVPRAPYAMNPVPPFGVPAVISLAFWGGVWGALMIPVIDKQRGARYWIAAIVFGAVLPTLVAWFLVAPLKHQPMASGWKPKTMMIGPIVNAAWGFGTALLYRLFVRR
jgi:uncharacterized membrane protein